MSQATSGLASGVIKSFLTIFFISKLFGCNLYSLPTALNSANVNVPLRAIDISICLIQVVIQVFVILPLTKKWESYDSVFNNEFATKIGSSGLVVIVFIGQFLSFLTMFTNLLILIMDMRNSATIRGILLSLIHFDKKMEVQDLTFNVGQKKISLLYAFITLLWQLPTFGLSLLISNGTNDTRLIFIIETYLGHTIIVGCVASFMTTYWFFLASLADRFSFVNKCLKKHLMERQKGSLIDSTFSHTDSKKQFLNDYIFIGKLSNAHQNLVNIVDRINKCNTLQFIFSAAIIFSSLIVTSFMIYQLLSVEIEHITPATGVFYTFRTVYYTFLLYKTISVGSEIRNQKKISQSLLNKAISLQQNKIVLIQLHHFSYQIEHSNIVVSCGLFPVDWTLLYTLSTAMATYLLLFIQFDSIYNTVKA